MSGFIAMIVIIALFWWLFTKGIPGYRAVMIRRGMVANRRGLQNTHNAVQPLRHKFFRQNPGATEADFWLWMEHKGYI